MKKKIKKTIGIILLIAFFIAVTLFLGMLLPWKEAIMFWVGLIGLFGFIFLLGWLFED